MIVEPTPTDPRSPWRRARRLGALVLPVAVLVGVVGAGALGPRPEPPPSTRSNLDAAAATVLPASAPRASIAPVPAVPTQFGDLASTTPGSLVAARRAGRAPATSAVGGYLRVAPAADCADQPGGPLGPWCPRTGVLSDAPVTPDPASKGSMPPHVHVLVPIGVRLPAAVDRAARGAVENRVLVVGRFEGGARCGDPAGRCDDGFVVERFAWVDGVRVGLTPLIADRLDTGTRRPNPFQLALDAADLPLSAVLVWPDAVPGIDPAAGAVAAAGPSNEPVWYVRVLDDARGPGPERTIRWMLLAEKDLRVLGSGRPDGVTARVADPGPG